MQGINPVNDAMVSKLVLPVVRQRTSQYVQLLPNRVKWNAARAEIIGALTQPCCGLVFTGATSLV